MTEGIRLRKDIREESILTTALQLLSRNGVDGLTMRELAKEEGISEAMLYRFYKNKYEIIHVIIQSNLEKILAEWKEFLATVKALIPDLDVSLPIVSKMLAKTITENQQFLQFILRDRFKLQKIFLKYSREGKKTSFESPFVFSKVFQSINLLEVITNYFERCKKAGNLRDDIPPYDSAILFTTNIVQLIVNFPTLIFQGEFGDIDILKLVDIQIKVMLQGLKPK